MIDAYVGIPGSGKTYMLVSRGLQDWLRGYEKARKAHHAQIKAHRPLPADPVASMPPVNEYKALRSNFALDLPSLVRYLVIRRKYDRREAAVLAASTQIIRNYQELLDCHNTLILLAEAQLWFNARDFAYFPTEVLAFWTQSRHAGVDVYFDTQKYEMVDGNIRGLVANLYRARPTAWQVKLWNLVLHKLGIINAETAALPVFRYSSWMDEAEGNISKNSKGFVEAAAKNEVRRLDPLIAAVYQTKGMTYAPSSELHQAFGTQKSKAAQTLGLKFDLTKFHEAISGPQSLYPPLDVRDAARAYQAGVPLADLVAQLHGRLEQVDVHEPVPAWTLDDLDRQVLDLGALPVSYPLDIPE